jgi:hypothetical protein
MSGPVTPRDLSTVSPRTPRSQFNEAYEFAGMHHLFVEHNKPGNITLLDKILQDSHNCQICKQ